MCNDDEEPLAAALSSSAVLPAPPGVPPDPAGQGIKAGTYSKQVRSGMGLADVIGAENRDRIGETTAQPWQFVCSLIAVVAGEEKVLGTGTLVAPRVVLTAGHCINKRFDRIVVVPGRNGHSEPFGRQNVMPSAFHVHPGWEKYKHKDRDAGALILDKPFDGIDSWMVVASPDPSALINCKANIAGYPAVSPNKVKTKGDEMWFHSNAVKDASKRILSYAVDTSAGQSGAPIWVYGTRSSPATIVGIHAYGVTNNLVNSPGAANSGTRIDDDLARHIGQWASI